MSATETKTMTENEALALVGDHDTNDFEYYKYSVTYLLDTDEFSAALYYGGESDDVYRFTLTPRSSENIAAWIEDECDCTITRKSDGAKFERLDRW